MDKMPGETGLNKIHEEVISTGHQFELPWPILSQAKEEYLGYLQKAARNYYLQ